MPRRLQFDGGISVGARDFSPENISIGGLKSPAPNKTSCTTISDLSLLLNYDNA